MRETESDPESQPFASPPARRKLPSPGRLAVLLLGLWVAGGTFVQFKAKKGGVFAGPSPVVEETRAVDQDDPVPEGVATSVEEVAAAHRAAVAANQSVTPPAGAEATSVGAPKPGAVPPPAALPSASPRPGNAPQTGEVAAEAKFPGPPSASPPGAGPQPSGSLPTNGGVGVPTASSPEPSPSPRKKRHRRRRHADEAPSAAGSSAGDSGSPLPGEAPAERAPGDPGGSGGGDRRDAQPSSEGGVGRGAEGRAQGDPPAGEQGGPGSSEPGAGRPRDDGDGHPRGGGGGRPRDPGDGRSRDRDEGGGSADPPLRGGQGS